MTGMKVAALAGAATSIFAFFDLADAQEGEAEIRRIEPDAAIVTDGRQTYPADFFIGFSPVTALDMITRLPGYSLDGGDTGRRGLGDSFGNLLINGRRPSNKSISLDTVLQRIPAGDVERIELISDSAGEFEMRGHPRLANVILREGAGESTSWDLRLRYWDVGRITPSGSISMSRRLGEVTELTLGLEGSLSARRFNRREALYDGAGNWLERRSESDQRESWEINPTFSLNTTLGDGSELRFDGRGWIWEWRRQNVGFVDGTQPGGGFAPMRISSFNDERVKAKAVVGPGTTRHLPVVLETINNDMASEPDMPLWAGFSNNEIPVSLGKLLTGQDYNGDAKACMDAIAQQIDAAVADAGL